AIRGSREPEHLEVAVRVSDRDEWTSAQTAPDPYWLLGAVVEELDLRLVHQTRDVGVVGEIEAERTADHTLWWDAVEPLCERANEVSVASRRDVCRETVGFEVAQQFDHRHETTREVRALQHRVGGRLEPLVNLAGEFLYRHALERFRDCIQKQT